MKIVPETSEGDVRVPQGFIPREISEFSDSDKESVATGYKSSANYS